MLTTVQDKGDVVTCCPRCGAVTECMKERDVEIVAPGLRHVVKQKYVLVTPCRCMTEAPPSPAQVAQANEILKEMQARMRGPGLGTLIWWAAVLVAAIAVWRSWP